MPEHDHDYAIVGRSARYPATKDRHRACRKPSCPGIAYVQIAWAPDTTWHWLKCCCCGDYWNPGEAIYAPGVGEAMTAIAVGQKCPDGWACTDEGCDIGCKRVRAGLIRGGW